jgi:hypothetical protein
MCIMEANYPPSAAIQKYQPHIPICATGVSARTTKTAAQRAAPAKAAAIRAAEKSG